MSVSDTIQRCVEYRLMTTGTYLKLSRLLAYQYKRFLLLSHRIPSNDQHSISRELKRVTDTLLPTVYHQGFGSALN